MFSSAVLLLPMLCAGLIVRFLWPVEPKTGHLKLVQAAVQSHADAARCLRQPCVKGQIVVYVGLFRDLQKLLHYSGDGEGGWPWGVHWMPRDCCFRVSLSCSMRLSPEGTCRYLFLMIFDYELKETDPFQFSTRKAGHWFGVGFRNV